MNREPYYERAQQRRRDGEFDCGTAQLVQEVLDASGLFGKVEELQEMYGEEAARWDLEMRNLLEQRLHPLQCERATIQRVLFEFAEAAWNIGLLSEGARYVLERLVSEHVVETREVEA